MHTDRRMAEVKIFQNKTKLPYEAWMVRSPEILRLRCFLERAQTYHKLGYIGVITHLLAIDTNFQRDIQVVWAYYGVT